MSSQERVAGLFGKEAALFTPTGSMANVLALASLVGPGQEVLCEARAHILRAELGAHGAYTGLTSRTWSHPRGQVDLPAIEEMYAPDMGPFFVRTTAVSVENTHNFAGGAVLPIDDLQALRSWADGVGCALHMDGARIWNAHVATGTPLEAYGALTRCAGGLPLQGSRRTHRLAVRRHPGPDRRGPRAAQADGRRDAPGRCARGRRALRARPPPRADGRGPRPRAADRRGVRRRPGHGRHEHRGGRRTVRARAGHRRRRAGRARRRRRARAGCGCSPTSTSAATTPSGPRRCSARCSSVRS